MEKLVQSLTEKKEQKPRSLTENQRPLVTVKEASAVTRLLGHSLVMVGAPDESPLLEEDELLEVLGWEKSLAFRAGEPGGFEISGSISNRGAERRVAM